MARKKAKKVSKKYLKDVAYRILYQLLKDGVPGELIDQEMVGAELDPNDAVNRAYILHMIGIHTHIFKSHIAPDELRRHE